ncbi:M28 family peptidase [Reichenbachiella agarivorans]|uniref:M28 family peptidase n=1 Tax=Reichenbachiella agarivorans TaxID=2979464 RepID=A0ABY6CSR3_9BACT|nr:M28 family peptidase [Reichenbachiella agarivorans]UXP33040.1 M28 family peptidase [Reichenbachiella agarivorans]
MIKKLLLSFLFFFCLLVCQGQHLPYAKEVVQKLASPAFKGRGYVEKGEQIAAQYVAEEFEKIGLKPFKKSYFQTFTTSVNTFPSAMMIALDGKEIVAGQDYLVEAGSPGLSGSFPVLSLSAEDILDEATLIQTLQESNKKFILIQDFDRKEFVKEQLQRIDEVISFLKYNPENPAAGTIILTSGKLTWGASTQQYSKPNIILKIDSTYTAINQISLEIGNQFYKNYKTQNVIGFMTGERSDSLMVYTAHYDHLGMMGENAIFPGANDNASGVAMLLSLAKHYQTHPPRFNTIFIAFGGEELGLLGSQYFVQNPLFDLSKIKFLVNFDITGTGEDGIQVVNGSVYREQFDRLTAINDEMELLSQVKIRGQACNSDHCMFDQMGVPCFFIYTLGGIQAYHDIYDRAETLPLTEFEDYLKLIVAFADEL